MHEQLKLLLDGLLSHLRTKWTIRKTRMEMIHEEVRVVARHIVVHRGEKIVRGTTLQAIRTTTKEVGMAKEELLLTENCTQELMKPVIMLGAFVAKITLALVFRDHRSLIRKIR